MDRMFKKALGVFAATLMLVNSSGAFAASAFAFADITGISIIDERHSNLLRLLMSFLTCIGICN